MRKNIAMYYFKIKKSNKKECIYFQITKISLSLVRIQVNQTKL